MKKIFLVLVLVVYSRFSAIGASSPPLTAETATASAQRPDSTNGAVANQALTPEEAASIVQQRNQTDGTLTDQELTPDEAAALEKRQRANGTLTGVPSVDNPGPFVISNQSEKYNDETYGRGATASQSEFASSYTTDVRAGAPMGLLQRRPHITTAFENFVAQSVGYPIRTFGADLFQQVPTTFAPMTNVPVGAEYVIGPGDEIVIHAWGQLDVNYRAVVDHDGNIFVPKVGQIHLADVRNDQLQQVVNQEFSRYFKNYQLTATLGKLRSIQVFVVGHAYKPGLYTISALSTLLNALFATGGPSETGSLRHFQLRRSNQIVTELDLYDLLLRGDKSKDALLHSGDVIFIPAVGAQAAIVGGVNAPAIYEIKNDTTLAELVQLAGGLSTIAEGDRARVERIKGHQARIVTELSLDQTGLASRMEDGDLVRIDSISPRFQNAVTLRGNVANPGRYAWHQGMRVSNLIPNRDALITRQFWMTQNAEVGAQNLQSVGSIARREGVPSASAAGGLQSDGKQSLQNTSDSAEELRNDLERNAPEINWDYAVIERTELKELKSELLPFNLGHAIDNPSSPDDLPLKPGDVVTIFSQKDIKVPHSKQAKFVRLQGEVARPGIYRVEKGETLRDVVAQAGGLTPNAYLFASELLRESVRTAQQTRMDEALNRLTIEAQKSGLRKTLTATNADEAQAAHAQAEQQNVLLERLKSIHASGRIILNIRPDASTITDIPALSLEDGDRFTVPFRPATVSVIGAVYNAADFVYSGHSTVRRYISEAGGPTRTADKSHIYVIRASGQVEAANRSGWLNASLVSEHLMPGDTIVVPENLDRVPIMKSIRDFSTVLSGFGLAAAAINVLR